MAIYGVIVLVAVPATRPPVAPRVACVGPSPPSITDRAFVVFVAIMFGLVLLPFQSFAPRSAHMTWQGRGPRHAVDLVPRARRGRRARARRDRARAPPPPGAVTRVQLQEQTTPKLGRGHSAASTRELLDWRVRRHVRGRHGMRTRTRVPALRADVTSTVPPRRPICSRTLTSPNPVGGASSAGSKPTPASATTTST